MRYVDDMKAINCYKCLHDTRGLSRKEIKKLAFSYRNKKIFLRWSKEEENFARNLNNALNYLHNMIHGKQN